MLWQAPLAEPSVGVCARSDEALDCACLALISYVKWSPPKKKHGTFVRSQPRSLAARERQTARISYPSVRIYPILSSSEYDAFITSIWRTVFAATKVPECEFQSATTAPAHDTKCAARVPWGLAQQFSSIRKPLSPAADPTLEPGCPADVTWKGWKIMQIGPLCERRQPPSAAGKARPALCIVQSPQNSGHWQATNETAR